MQSQELDLQLLTYGEKNSKLLERIRLELESITPFKILENVEKVSGTHIQSGAAAKGDTDDDKISESPSAAGISIDLDKQSQQSGRNNDKKRKKKKKRKDKIFHGVGNDEEKGSDGDCNGSRGQNVAEPSSPKSSKKGGYVQSSISSRVRYRANNSGYITPKSPRQKTVISDDMLRPINTSISSILALIKKAEADSVRRMEVQMEIEKIKNESKRIQKEHLESQDFLLNSAFESVGIGRGTSETAAAEKKVRFG